MLHRNALKNAYKITLKIALSCASHKNALKKCLKMHAKLPRKVGRCVKLHKNACKIADALDFWCIFMHKFAFGANLHTKIRRRERIFWCICAQKSLWGLFAHKKDWRCGRDVRDGKGLPPGTIEDPRGLMKWWQPLYTKSALQSTCELPPFKTKRTSIHHKDLLNKRAKGPIK